MIIHKTFGIEKADSGYVEGYISGEDTDRDGDQVVQSGIDYSKASVLLNQHNHAQPIGKLEAIERRPQGLWARFKFASNNLAQEARTMVSEGILTSFSIGFMVLESEPIKTGFRFLKTELLETSLVSVPSQSAALVTAVKSFEEETMENAQPVGELKKVPSVHTTEHKYSVNNVLQRALEGEKPQGIEQEFHQEAVKRMGERGSKARGIQIPLSALFPKKSHGTVSADPGNTLNPLVGVDYMDSLFTQTGDAIIACPLAKRLGMMQITSSEETVHIPVQTGPLEAGWVARDKPFHRSKDAIFTGLDMTPKILSLLTMFERSSIYATHPQARALLMAQIGQVVSAALDTAVVEGGVAEGPQMGLLSDATAGDNAVLATLAAGIHKNMSALERYTKCDMRPTVVMAPETLHEMSSIPAWSGATVPLLQSGILDSLYPTVSSVKMPYVSGTQVGTALMGDFSTGVLCLWDSVGVELNPYTKDAWEKGAVDARLFLEADFVLRDVNLVRKFTVTTK